MVEDKAKAISETGAELLVNGDCGCLMNITGHMEQQSNGQKGQHIASFIWKRTHADGDFHLSVDDVLSNHKVRGNFRSAMGGLIDKRKRAFPSPNELTRLRLLGEQIRASAAEAELPAQRQQGQHKEPGKPAFSQRGIRLEALDLGPCSVNDLPRRHPNRHTTAWPDAKTARPRDRGTHSSKNRSQEPA